MDVTPVSAEGEPEPIYKKPVKIFNSSTQKILVPVYAALDVSYTSLTCEYGGKHFQVSVKENVRVTKPNDCLIWYATEMLLNGNLEWCAMDYGTLKNEGGKVGANALCACGSVDANGRRKKYKKCCGR